jgi:two-component system sensor histidine kinase RpfC
MKDKIRNFIQQVRQREGEHEQVVLRILFTLLIFAYLASSLLLDSQSQLPFHIFLFSGTYFTLSLVMFLVLLNKGHGSRKRQWISMFADIAAVTYGMLFTQEAGVLFYGIYLWVIVGNGIRYGLPSLIGGYIFSLVGFTLVITTNSFWSSQPRLSIGLMLTLTLVPLYILKLLNKLNQAMKTAHEANRAKSQFLAHMSHEMRTPLNGVIGTSDLLTTTPLNGEQYDLVNTLRISAQTLLQLIENVLDFAKIESGKLSTEKVDLDLHQLVRSTLDMFNSQAKMKGLRLNVRFSPETSFMLRGDPLHLRQIIINLVGNALKFTNKGSVELRVSTIRQDEATEDILFEVIDTGIGISAEAQKIIFESFTQAGADISRQYGGSGLGTTISKQLIHLMGGKMGVNSEPGTGSVFWFRLPFDKQQSANTDTSPRMLGQLRAITVGMSLHERQVVAGHLEGWGIKFEHEISLTNFFTQLLKLKSTQQKDVIVLCTPQNLGMDAREFASHVLEAMPAREFSLFLVASGLDKLSEQEVLEMGYSCLLHAPVDKTLLFNALHGVMTPQPQQGVISFKEHYQRNSLEKRGIHILLAEDNGTSRKIISKILEYGGHRVDTAENGEEALDRLDGTRYGLMILDMNMPLMGGLDVLKIHRATSRLSPPTPVIVLTANATVEAMRECEEANVDVYLTKPVDAVTLLDTIAKLTSTTMTEDAPEFSNADRETQESADAPSLLNQSTFGHLEKLSGGQEDFMPIVIRGFLSETEKLLDAMRIMLYNGNIGAFKELAHTVKGSAGNIGAEALQYLCRDIMLLSDDELNAQASSLLTRCQICYKATHAELTRYLSKSDNGSLFVI